jgi:ankyrin repeat protein
MKHISILVGILVAVGGAGLNVYRYSHFQIRDWKSVRIMLDRTTCLGTCPSYKIEVRGDGTVAYTGRDFVAITGQHAGRISQAALRDLVDAFRAANYFNLRGHYEAGITDGPTYTTSITFDGFHESVVDYMGQQASMPPSVSTLEETIDRLAGSQKWLCGNAETVPSLLEEGWDFKSPDIEHASVLARVAACGDVHAVHDLLAAGAPVESRDDVWGSTALVHAAQRGNIEMVRVLLEAGAGSNDKDEKGQALAFAAETGKLDLVQLLLRSGADPKYADAKGVTVLMSAARSGVPGVVAQILKYHPDVNLPDHQGQTALMNLDKDKIAGPRDPSPGERREEVARLLVHAGADVNARDNRGSTPLMETPWNAAAARVLIENGANVNARNNEGWTPLTHASSTEVVRLLLESGSDPFARDEKGLSELENKRHYSREGASLIEDAQAGKIGRPMIKQ